jgi:predicted transcriptional regulator
MHTAQQSNYSFDTSLPAYQGNQEDKQIQKKKLLAIFNQCGGRATLKEVADLMGLPQSTVSGRINDLIADKELMDTGEKKSYQGYTRKVFAVIKRKNPVAPNAVQKPLFDYKKIIQ